MTNRDALRGRNRYPVSSREGNAFRSRRKVIAGLSAAGVAALMALVIPMAREDAVAGATPVAATAAPATVRAAVASATASSDAGYAARNVLDSRPATRWSALGDGQWLRLDLGSALTITHVDLAFFKGESRRARFDLQTSDDGTTWQTVWSGKSSGTGAGVETFEIPDTTARYLRYLGHGNSANAWNALTDAQVHVAAATSSRVGLDADGKLHRPAYPNGDRLPDFSRAGYGGGGVALPTVPAARTVSPGEGDDGARIQATIDEVSALPADGNGLRGAVQLTTGTYEVDGSIAIRTGGVVLRGAGDGPDGTVIKATGTSTRNLISIAGSGGRREVAGSRQRITSPYVPVGAHTFTVADAAGLRVGDDVVVVRTPNQEWVDEVGMDACDTQGTARDTSDKSGSTCLSGTAWTPASRTVHYERRITAISGDEITIDSPVVQAFQEEFGGGAVYKYEFPGRIRQVGVEGIRAESAFVSETDEEHATYMINIVGAADAWVRNVTSRYFIQGTVNLTGGTTFVTVQDSASLDHKSQVTGGRRYPFSLNSASHVLFMRIYSETGRHDFVSGPNTPGPNVFLDSRAEKSRSELGPHHRWATGTLFDNVVHRSTNGKQIIGAYNRGNSGSGHGWSGAYQVFYNCVGDVHRVASPPHARNWSIGCRTASRQGDGEYDAPGTPVAPWSLYLLQLRERLGDAALTNIGY